LVLFALIDGILYISFEVFLSLSSPEYMIEFEKYVLRISIVENYPASDIHP